MCMQCDHIAFCKWYEVYIFSSLSLWEAQKLQLKLKLTVLNLYSDSICMLGRNLNLFSTCAIQMKSSSTELQFAHCMVMTRL